MKRLIIISCFVIVAIFSNVAFSQTYSGTQITISELEKGLNDFDYFRAVLLEKGFKFIKKNESDSEGLNEVWGVTYAKSTLGVSIDYTLLQVTIMSRKPWPPTISINVMTGQSLLSKEDSIFLAKYVSDYVAEIKAAFPEKKAQKSIDTTINGRESSKFYYLIYSKKGSNFYVNFDKSDKDIDIRFGEYK